MILINIANNKTKQNHHRKTVSLFSLYILQCLPNIMTKFCLKPNFFPPNSFSIHRTCTKIARMRNCTKTKQTTEVTKYTLIWNVFESKIATNWPISGMFRIAMNEWAIIRQSTLVIKKLKKEENVSKACGIKGGLQLENILNYSTVEWVTLTQNFTFVLTGVRTGLGWTRKAWKPHNDLSFKVLARNSFSNLNSTQRKVQQH